MIYFFRGPYVRSYVGDSRRLGHETKDILITYEAKLVFKPFSFGYVCVKC